MKRHLTFDTRTTTAVLQTRWTPIWHVIIHQKEGSKYPFWQSQSHCARFTVLDLMWKKNAKQLLVLVRNFVSLSLLQSQHCHKGVFRSATETRSHKIPKEIMRRTKMESFSTRDVSHSGALIYKFHSFHDQACHSKHWYLNQLSSLKWMEIALIWSSHQKNNNEKMCF